MPKRLVSYAIKFKERAESLGYAGIAHSMLQQFDAIYNLLSEAVGLDSTDAYLWYNLGHACRFTTRIGQSLQCFERAVSLEESGEMAERFASAVQFSQEIAQHSLELRGEGFSLEQLIAQEEAFQQGTQKMAAGQWEAAEQIFQRVIEMGDCLPQPWGNLGISLMMQQRYDEAESAYRRALSIDSRYAIARRNLKMLPRIRRSGPPPFFQMSEPFEKLKTSIEFQIEQ